MSGSLANKHSGIRDDEERPTTRKIDKHGSSKYHDKIEDLKNRHVNMRKMLSVHLPVNNHWRRPWFQSWWCRHHREQDWGNMISDRCCWSQNSRTWICNNRFRLTSIVRKCQWQVQCTCVSYYQGCWTETSKKEIYLFPLPSWWYPGSGPSQT